ncbi:MAG: HEAT repeat domain-containing protein [Pyrinomonadaceae bacterium]
MRYMEPAPHMALAKYFRDRGDRIQAFYILETARRGRFEQADFNRAFAAAFGGRAADAATREGEEAFKLGAAQQNEGRLREAEESLVKAADLSPHSSYIQAWVGRFFFKVKKDNSRALDYYLSAYLIDPHAYETEFVESRISKINDALAAAEFARKFRGGVPLLKIAEDPNPMVVLYALENMTGQWKPAYLPTALGLMGHDEGSVRWQATEAIKRNVDRSFDETLGALLRDDDLRKRGLALYIAAHLWGRESLPLMRAALREQSQLLRFDAVSSLFIDGGAQGRALVVEHLPRELNPRLKKMIQSGLREERGQQD